MITELYLKSRLRHAITADERSRLDDCVDEIIELPARKTLVKRAEKVDRSYYIVDGFMIRYIDDRRGFRQSVGIQVPGDWVDLHSFPMKRLDHDVVSLSAVRLAVFRHDRLSELIAGDPRLGRILWFSTLLDAAMHREWLFRLGRLNAEGRIAHLLCELIERLRFVDRFEGPEFPVPLTQQDFAEACGISAIHANRTFRILRERGLVDSSEGEGGIRILDESGLCKVGEFQPDYLYGDGALHLDDPY